MLDKPHSSYEPASCALRRTFLTLTFVSLLLFSILGPALQSDASPENWTSMVVDDQGDVGKYSSLALDSEGFVHISYYDQNASRLKYATNRDGQWDTEVVDGDLSSGTWSSLSLDGQGHAHISYMNLDLGELRYATNSGGSWVNQTVDDMGIVGAYSSLVLDEEGMAHISYHDATNQDLKYATNAQGFWERMVVDSQGITGMYSSIGLDSSGAVHISYHDATNHSLRYATNTGGAWETVTLDGVGEVGTFSSLVLDHFGEVHISYYDETKMDLKYASNSEGNWTTQVIDSQGQVGKYSSIAIGPSDGLYISYQDLDTLDLKFASNSSGFWTSITVDSSGEVGFWTSIAVASNGDSFISHYDQMNQHLRLTRSSQGPPSPPRDLVATPGNGYISLSWLPPSDQGGSSVINYKVYRGTDPQEISTDLGLLGNVLGYNDNSVENGITYYYRVSAWNDEGEGELSNITSTTPYGTPGPPINLVAEVVNGQVHLDWGPPADDGGRSVDSYRIYRGRSSATLSLLTTIGNLTMFTDGNISNVDSYTYRVSAVNEIGEGQLSSMVQVSLGSDGGDLDFTLIVVLVALVGAAVAGVLIIRRRKG